MAYATSTAEVVIAPAEAAADTMVAVAKTTEASTAAHTPAMASTTVVPATTVTATTTTAVCH